MLPPADAGAEGESFGFDSQDLEGEGADGTQQCAVKMLRMESTDEDQTEFSTECETMIQVCHNHGSRDWPC